MDNKLDTLENLVSEDLVNSPRHYQLSGGREVIDYIYEITEGVPHELAYGLGNAFKYVGRAPRKGNLIQDLKKASYYSRDAKTREWAGINYRNYSKALKSIRVMELSDNVTQFAFAVGETYPEGLREDVTKAIVLWADFFYSVAIRPKNADNISYVLEDWSRSIAEIANKARTLT